MAAPMPLTVVSTPAVSTERTTCGVSSGVSSPVSAAAWMPAPKPSGARLSRFDCSNTQATASRASAMAFSNNALRGPKLLKTMLPKGSR